MIKLFLSVIATIRLMSFLHLFSIISFQSFSQTQTVGLFLNDEKSFNGYTLFPPSNSKSTYLIDNCGEVVNTWASSYTPGQSAYLLEDGSLLRACNVNNVNFKQGGMGGRIEKHDWNGNLIWSYNYSTSNYCQHHDIKPLPNGNILLIAWENKTSSESMAAGKDPAYAQSTVWSERIVELQPIGSNQAKIIWTWKAWDHLIQDYDATKANFGVVADHPELININYTKATDIFHINSIDYNADLDQIVFSVHAFDEVWIIDHSTSTIQAKGHSGGKYGKGGDILYRYGNPKAYNRGTAADQVLNGQHDANWIPKGFPDEGKVMVFNNNSSTNASAVVVFAPPTDAPGIYTNPGISKYGPANFDFNYMAANFYSNNISGARKQANGNILICEGSSGHLFEITENGEVVWDYINPATLTGIVNQGDPISSNSVFKCFRYAPDYAAFVGKTLSTSGPVELNPWPSNCTLFNNVNYTLLQTSTISQQANSIKANIVTNENSSDEFLQLELEETKKLRIEMIDCHGKLVEEKGSREFSEGKHSISLNTIKLNSGIYFIRINTDETQVVLKFLK